MGLPGVRGNSGAGLQSPAQKGGIFGCSSANSATVYKVRGNLFGR